MAKAIRYLFDVNALIALLDENHVHHQAVTSWFTSTARRQWAVCAFTEAGFMRYATAPRPDQISMSQATEVLAKAAQHSGYHYMPITADWRTLCQPFFKRLYGTKQVTDSYLLGLAVREGLALLTMDKGIVHLAGDEYSKNVLLLEPVPRPI